MKTFALSLLLLLSLGLTAYEAEQFGKGDYEAAGAPAGFDRFGVAELFPTVPGGRTWVSTWDNGEFRNLRSGKRDPFDAESIARGNGYLEIDGQGVLKMSGSAPRIYIYDEPRQRKWQNVEVTVYILRADAPEMDLSYRGFGIGARSEHQDSANEIAGDKGPHKGLGYYGKVIYDGRIVFQKELLHHSQFGYSELVPRPNARDFWDTPGGAMPKDVWVGVKFIVRNVGADQVKLELYRDLTDGKDGGKWEKMIEYTDRGGWTKPGLTPELIQANMPAGSPPFAVDQILREPGTSVFIRNDGIEDARLKKMSIREIAPLE